MFRCWNVKKEKWIGHGQLISEFFLEIILQRHLVWTKSQGKNSGDRGER
jgi:hypothetical protein